MKKTAGYRLRDLKRRSGYDANILPAKRPALSVADRVAKVDNVALLQMHLPWTHTTFVCLLVLGEGRECQRFFCYLQQQIILRSDNKKMMRNERIDWPTRDIAKLWSDLLSLLLLLML